MSFDPLLLFPLQVEIASHSEANIRFIMIFGGLENPLDLPHSRWMPSPQTSFLSLHEMVQLAWGVELFVGEGRGVDGEALSVIT